MTRTRESGYSLSLSKQRAICSQPRLLFLVAKVIRQGATLPLQAEWHTSLLVKKKIKGKLQKKSEGKGFLKVNEQFFSVPFESGDVLSMSPHSMSIISGTGCCPFSTAILHKPPENKKI